MRLSHAKSPFGPSFRASHQFWSHASMIMTTSDAFLIMLRLRCQAGLFVSACPAALALPLCHPMKGVMRSPTLLISGGIATQALLSESLRELSWYQVATPMPSAADWV